MTSIHILESWRAILTRLKIICSPYLTSYRKILDEGPNQWEICFNHIKSRHASIVWNDAYMQRLLNIHDTDHHYSDVIRSAMVTQITRLTIVYSAAYSGTNQRKHQSFASLAFVWGMWGIHRWPWIPHTKVSNAVNISIWWRHHDNNDFSELFIDMWPHHYSILDPIFQ